MYLGQEFPPFQNQGARLLGADLQDLLGDETISAVTSRLRTLSGTDDLPAEHLPINPAFSGSRVAQLVSFNDPADRLLGNRYALSWSVTTSGGRVLLPWARFQVVRGFGVSQYDDGTPATATRGTVIRAAQRYYTLPSKMGGYVGQDFPTANQGETLVYGIDFTPLLSPDETISTASSFLALLDGTDAAVAAEADAYNSGSAAISGNVVTQTLVWPAGSTLVGNVYMLSLTADTSQHQALAAWARIFVGRIG